jgi:hypothetical protein
VADVAGPEEELGDRALAMMARLRHVLAAPPSLPAQPDSPEAAPAPRRNGRAKR